jgi:hypothetical protein
MQIVQFRIPFFSDLLFESDFPPDHSHDRPDILNLILRHRQIIPIENQQIRQLPC